MIIKVARASRIAQPATMTLDLYGHLFENQLDEVADEAE
jgi:hypothetical protein